MMRVLLLGGTTEASLIGRELATAGIAGVYSYAGRTATPVAQPLRTRVGGFGGVDGLAEYLRHEEITHVIDATHPFAGQISRNAVDACAKTNTPLIAYLREPWVEGPGDKWQRVATLADAAAALPDHPARIFLAIGRQHLAPFAAQPRHFYLLRLVDAPVALPLPDAEIVLARGPFTIEGDLALLRDHRITHIVARNAGGEGAKAKLDAARMLGLPVIMIDRPGLPARRTAQNVGEIMRWLTQSACLGV
ncbi:cobalt-precorrin-6A reductase [Bradyrhizobium roseum]|uniref:cobalt-precorrin-6A reductase n=1 Tax=Bradyrhizobium roseum TaxID=3056648 RepID=UPI0026040B0D|nr:cobalt-precorrin-6A reductase [Bradyrhizobium roseus]WKA30304.1 cobalt-precorrin-6A reductase [Bradyrhizobium roseus]